jgi:hypothetical protein
VKTILHIGMPKTGSTALQGALAASRDRLAARGALYPTNPPGCPFENHRLLVLGFTRFADLPRHIRKHALYDASNLGTHYAAFLAHLRAEVDAARPERLVLSSETLFRRLGPAARRSLGAAVAGFGETRVAVYLRRPSSYYLSALQQKLKSAHRVIPPRVQSPVAVLESYAAVFGAGSVRARVYDRSLLARGDIVADFLAAHLDGLGLDAGALRRGRDANETVSAEAMDLMRRFRRAFHPEAENVPTPDDGRLLRALRAADRETGAPRPRLRPEIAEAIDYARADPLRLRDAWGVEFPDFDYRRLERGVRTRGAFALLRGLWRPWRLEEIVAIDPALRRALIDRLAASPWAAAEPARAAWAAGLLRDPELRG